MTSKEIILWLGARQLELYRMAPGNYIKAFQAGSCNREIIRQYYQVLVSGGLITPLEGIEPDVKDELKKMAIEYSDGKLNLSGVMNMAKLIHIIASYV